MRRTPRLAAATLLGLALVAPTTSASVAAETCRGEVATLVGATPTVTGTEGRDVIITGTATTINALGGDDLVCVAPKGSRTNLVEVDAGPGDDLVDTTSADRSSSITSVLGTGADTLVGGVGHDGVYAGTGRESPRDSEADRIDTGENDDVVTSGEPGSANRDSITLGSGTDTLALGGPLLAPEAVLDPGPDGDRIAVTTGDTDVTIDLAAQTLATPAGTHAIGAFEQAQFSAGTATLGFRGTSGNDFLTVRSSAGTPHLVADLGAGDDGVILEPAALAPGSRIDGGRGRDNLVAAVRRGFLALDLETDRLRIGNGASTATGFETAHLMAPRAALVGDDRANYFLFTGCEASIRGGRGGDYVVSSSDYVFESYSYGCKAELTVHGGSGGDEISGGQGPDRIYGEGGKDLVQGRGGADRIRGGDNRDTLLGGPGRDTTMGGAGRDRCTAEVEMSCER